jgi:Rrf2 family protein
LFRYPQVVHLLAQEEYGLRCLVQVARNDEEGPTSAAAIADAEGLSPEYAARLLGVLRRAQLVRSTRGARGGYELTRPPSQITVWEVVEALGGPLFSERFCLSYRGQARDCVHVENCSVRGLWQAAERSVRRLFGGISIADLARGEEAARLCLNGLGPVVQRASRT